MTLLIALFVSGFIFGLMGSVVIANGITKKNCKKCKIHQNKFGG